MHRTARISLALPLLLTACAGDDTAALDVVAEAPDVVDEVDGADAEAAEPADDDVADEAEPEVADVAEPIRVEVDDANPVPARRPDRHRR